MTPLRRRIAQRVILLSLAALVAACGGGEEEATAGAAPPPSSSAPPPSNPTNPPVDPDPTDPTDPGPSDPGPTDPADPGPSEPSDPSPPANRSPVIGGTPSPEVLVGTQFSFTPSASDPDNDVLTFSIQNRPAWASFNSTTGRLSGTPGEEDVGTYGNIRIRVTDGEATVALPAFSVEVVPTATGAATLTWTPPTTRTDGTALAVAGYKVYWGTESGTYPNTVTLDAGISTHVIDQLTPGTWYFAVTALDEHNIESDFSNEASKHISM